MEILITQSEIGCCSGSNVCIASALISGVRMEIDLLYFNDCPSWKQALDNLDAALTAEKISAEIKLILVESDEAAAREKFLGSPSIRVDGHDLWPEDRQSYHLGCRVYATEAGIRGVPSLEMLRIKIRRFQSAERS
jgi:hypothetical protein